tara:strand:- start:10752 stop:11855 length:1104 start_codon:yes stop_codon:yes gene_type:complete
MLKMVEKFDYLIVGAGFTGSVLAERLNSIGKKVLLVDKRNHIGGNCYDYFDKYGVLTHKYGPHYFRTKFQKVWDYLSQFTEWIPYEARIKSSINNELYPIPINRNTLNLFFNINLETEEQVREFLDSKKENIQNPKNAEEQVLANAGREIYNAFFKNYTIKQWQTDPKNLDASITSRISIRTNDDDRLFDYNLQAMPKEGYFKIFKNMLKNIKILLNTDFKNIKNFVEYDKLIFTGPIDSFFDYKFGKLPYRSLKFIRENYNKEFFQPTAQINYPNEFEYTRIVEIKHATKQKCFNTTIVKEFPSQQGDPFYPILNNKNQELYLKYKQEADKLDNIYFIGRLAQYKYLDMDQVINGALELFEKIKTK